MGARTLVVEDTGNIDWRELSQRSTLWYQDPDPPNKLQSPVLISLRLNNQQSPTHQQSAQSHPEFTEGRRRRGRQSIWWLDGITNSMCYWKRCVGLAARRSKAKKQARLAERKVSDAGTLGEGWWTSVQRLTLPYPDNQGMRAFIDRLGEGLHADTTQSSLSHLQICHQCSDQHHLGCFRYS